MTDIVKQVTTVGLSLAVMVMTVTQGGAQTTLSSPTIGRYCGHDLRNALALICAGRGYNFKRAAPFAGKIDKRTQRRGIIHECCYERCSYWDLEQYCAPANGRDVVSEQEFADYLSGGSQTRVHTTTRPEYVTYTLPTLAPQQDVGTEAPSAELLRGEADPEDWLNFFYVQPHGYRPTRNPLFSDERN